MPLPSTHALVPIAAAIAISPRPVPWRLITVAVVAAMLPDLDGLSHHLFGVSNSSIFSHRGMAHSLLVALTVGAMAAAFHRSLGVRYVTAAVVIALAMASHGLLDMMTDSGKPVAYLWPLTPTRLFEIWRPIHSMDVHRRHFFEVSGARLWSELRQVIVPLMLAAIAFRMARLRLAKASAWRQSR